MSLVCKERDSGGSQSGSALLECSLLLPVLLLLGFGTYELWKMYSINNRASGIAHYLSQSVLQKCSTLPNEKLQDCLNQVATDFDGALEELNLAAETVVAIYKKKAEGVAVERWIYPDSGVTRSGYRTYYRKVSFQSGHPDNRLRPLMDDLGVVVVGEVWFDKYSSIFTFAGEVYASAIF